MSGMTFEKYKKLVQEQGEILLEAVRSVVSKDLDVKVEVSEGIQVFSDLAVGIGKMLGDFREMMAEREGALAAAQSQARQLQAAVEVSCAVTFILDEDELLDTSVNLLGDCFGFYHVGLFLADEENRFAVLRAGAGKAGQAMLEEGYKLEVGDGSLVGWCIAHRETRVARNVDGEEVALPLMRSEVALPLVFEDQVLGALAVQSTEEAGFSDEDVAVLQTLADQVANALVNARRFGMIERVRAETDKRRREIDCLNDIGRRMEEACPLPELLSWVAARIPPAMQYPSDCVVAIEYDGQIYGAPEASTLLWQVVQVLRTDKGAVGRVYVAYIEEHDFIDEESTLLGDIARRVSSYVENQRLLREAQVRAERERLVRTIADRVHRGTGTEVIMRITLEELGQMLGAFKSVIRLGTQAQLCPGSGEGLLSDQKVATHEAKEG